MKAFTYNKTQDKNVLIFFCFVKQQYLLTHTYLRVFHKDLYEMIS